MSSLRLTTEAPLARHTELRIEVSMNQILIPSVSDISTTGILEVLSFMSAVCNDGAIESTR